MSEDHIAYANTVTLHEAKWTDLEGSTVTVKLPMVGMEGQRNPFEKFTKRRKGHAGTRFMAVFLDDLKNLVYENEAMLAGWNDSQSNGHTVKLWLARDEMGHPFDGYERKKSTFYMSLVELDDDDAPVNQKARDRIESKGKSPSQRLSYVAAMLCKNPDFQKWVGVKDEETARSYILHACSIDSRADLDTAERGSWAWMEFNNIRRHFSERKVAG